MRETFDIKSEKWYYNHVGGRLPPGGVPRFGVSLRGGNQMKVREMMMGKDMKVTVLVPNTRHTDRIVAKDVFNKLPENVLDLVVRYSYVFKDVVSGDTMIVACEGGDC